MGKRISEILGWVIMACFIYLAVLLAWLFILWILGYESPKEKQRNEELRGFVLAHKISFCKRESIPPQHCDQLFHGSAAEDFAVSEWTKMILTRDKQEKGSFSFSGLFEPFIEPFQK